MEIINLIASKYQDIVWIGLLVNSFLSATVLPLSSEILFLALLKVKSHPIWFLWLIATIGNSLGGITNLCLGRLFAQKLKPPKESRLSLTAIRWIHQYGYYSLLLSWVPMIGDLLCIIAGWQRLEFKRCLIYLILGKGLRYGLLTLPFYLY